MPSTRYSVRPDGRACTAVVARVARIRSTRSTETNAGTRRASVRAVVLRGRASVVDVLVRWSLRRGLVEEAVEYALDRGSSAAGGPYSSVALPQVHIAATAVGLVVMTCWLVMMRLRLHLVAVGG